MEKPEIIKQATPIEDASVVSFNKEELDRGMKHISRIKESMAKLKSAGYGEKNFMRCLVIPIGRDLFRVASNNIQKNTPLNVLAKEAARVTSKAAIDFMILQQKDDPKELEGEFFHLLQKIVRYEQEANLHDEVTVKLENFMAFAFDSRGDFEMGLSMRNVDYSSLADEDDARKLALENRNLYFQKYPDLVEAETVNMGLRVDKFNELVESLSTDIAFMQIKPEENMVSLLNRAENILRDHMSKLNDDEAELAQ